METNRSYYSDLYCKVCVDKVLYSNTLVLQRQMETHRSYYSDLYCKVCVWVKSCTVILWYSRERWRQTGHITVTCIVM